MLKVGSNPSLHTMGITTTTESVAAPLSVSCGSTSTNGSSEGSNSAAGGRSLNPPIVPLRAPIRRIPQLASTPENSQVSGGGGGQQQLDPAALT